jgi:hypothetical protein
LQVKALARAYPSEVPNRSTVANIRLEQKMVTVIKALGYYAAVLITIVKYFIVEVKG